MWFPTFIFYFLIILLVLTFPYFSCLDLLLSSSFNLLLFSRYLISFMAFSSFGSPTLFPQLSLSDFCLLSSFILLFFPFLYFDRLNLLLPFSFLLLLFSPFFILFVNFSSFQSNLTSYTFSHFIFFFFFCLSCSPPFISSYPPTLF